MEARDWWGGKLLVATPLIEEATFRRSVVALIHHDDEGAFGVILNRPSLLSVGEPFPEWQGLAADPPVMFSGGPVAPSAVVCLARVSGDEPAGWAAVMEGVGAVDLNRDIDEIRPSVDAVRLFSGYAGWSADQLEEEVAEGAWVVVDAEPGDALSDDPEALWRTVLLRQPGSLRLMAWFPPDATLQ